MANISAIEQNTHTDGSMDAVVIRLRPRPIGSLTLIKSTDLSEFDAGIFEVHSVDIVNLEPSSNHIHCFARCCSEAIIELYALIVIPSATKQVLNLTLKIIAASRAKVDGRSWEEWRKSSHLPPLASLFRIDTIFNVSMQFDIEIKA